MANADDNDGNRLPLAEVPGEALASVTGAGAQFALPFEAGEVAEVVVRPERNLEKWPIWEPSNSRHRMRARTLTREIRLADGSAAHAKVEVGFTNNGALTTEDQKTCYALFRIWEENGKPQGRVYFTRQQLARVLKKSWGSKTNQAITDSLMRLRFTPFVWERSYFDSLRNETVERIDTFSILSGLHLTRRTAGETTVAEMSYFEFNERILANLEAGFTRPVYLDTMLRFRSEIAQILYTHLDLVMANKTLYERRSRELFADLGIDGETYKFPSKRAQALESALKELANVPVPHGLISVSLERTADGADFKIVARKTPVARPLSRVLEGAADGIETLYADADPDDAPFGGARPLSPVALTLPIEELPPPVVTQVINAPPEPRKKRPSGAGKAAAKGAPAAAEKATGQSPASETPVKAPARPVEAAPGADASANPPEPVKGRQRLKSGQVSGGGVAQGVAPGKGGAKTAARRAAEEPGLDLDGTDVDTASSVYVDPAAELVRFFYEQFHGNGGSARPTNREKALAADHLVRLGPDAARHLVRFARQEAQKTRFAIQTYAGICQYEARALSALAERDDTPTPAAPAGRPSVDARDAHRRRHEPAYLAYLSGRLSDLTADPAPEFAPFLAAEKRGRDALLALGAAPDDPRLAAYDAPEKRLARFRDFLAARMKRGERAPGILSFWEWDAQENPEPFAGA